MQATVAQWTDLYHLLLLIEDNKSILISSFYLYVLPASPLLGSPLGRSRHSSSQSDLTGPPSNSSGLSFTACMSDFSLYVFHPYGAGKQKSAVTGLPPGPGPLGMQKEEGKPVVIFSCASSGLQFFMKISFFHSGYDFCQIQMYAKVI